MNENRDVVITEVLPRDGFQSISEFIPTDTKKDIINEILACDFEQLEVTSFVHPRAIPQLKDASELLKLIKRDSNTKLRALIPNLIGLERAIEAGVDKVKLMLSATDSHSISNANAKTFDVLSSYEKVVDVAKQNNMPVSGSVSVAFGCPFEGSVSIERLKSIVKKYNQLGVKEISLADTSGMANPVLVKDTISELKDNFDDVTFTLHLHNTRGMAFANAVAGFEAGVRDFDASIAGIGGCPYIPNGSGNISSEDLIHGLEEMGISTGVNLDKVINLGRKISEKYSGYSDSYLLKAGKSSDLSVAPKKQEKVGEKN